MNKVPYSYDGTSLNDSNFESWIVEGQTILANATPRWVPQNGAYPQLSGTTLTGGAIVLHVACKGTIQTQQETLKKLFDINTSVSKTFMIYDSADGNRQWYVKARPLDIQRDGVSNVFIVSMALASPVWIQTTPETETAWSITSSGSTKTVNKDIGNLVAYPVLDITPVTTKNSGQKYRRFIQTYNYTKLAAGAYPIDITGGGLNTTGLVADATISNQINQVGGITAVATSIPIDTAVGGGLPISGMGYIDTEQISWTGNSGTLLSGVSRGIAGTTAATHADNAVIKLSHIKADGSDIRVRVGTTAGNPVDTTYWLSTTSLASATALKIWATISYPAKVYGKLKADITNSQTSIILYSQTTYGNPNFYTSGGTILIGSERITYTAYNSTTKTFTGCTRGALDSSAASHLINVEVMQIPVVYLYYGNPDITAPVYSVARKPIFDLVSSTNTSWVYDSFRANAQSGLDRWTPSTSTNPPASTFTYSSDRDLTNTSQVDPVVEMGCSVIGASQFARWMAIFPFGFTSAVFTNIDRYNVPASSCLIQSAYSSEPVLTTAASATTLSDTWQTENKTHTPSTPARTLVFLLRNATFNAYGKQSACNVATVTVTLSNAATSLDYGIPSITLGSEQSVEYELEATITNNTTGLSVSIKTDVPFGQTLRIDTLNKTVRALWDNTTRFSDFRISTIRDEWLKLTDGNNQLQYDETGVVSVSIAISWQGRNN